MSNKFNNAVLCEFGKAAFYAALLPELKEVAFKCGWAIAIHGSLNKDADIMAMPWTENAVQHQELIRRISDECFQDNPFKDTHCIPYKNKPNKRIVYTISIWSGYYLDINIIGD